MDDIDTLIMEARLESKDKFIEELLAKGGICMRLVADLKSVISVVEDRLDAMACFENPDEGNIVRLLEWIHGQCDWLEEK